jgi:two-component system, OmpR family, alkaline phosphatase synthesis response regulator PhoP
LRERLHSGIVSGQSTQGGRMARAVLIVDDEQHIRLLIEQTLEELLDEDVELYTAADGDEAIAAIAAQHPDLVFLDVMMPGRSGLDVCRAVRADPELAGAYIVLLTAKGQAQDRAEGLDAGADEFLTKPFDPDALLALARGVLGLA